MAHNNQYGSRYTEDFRKDFSSFYPKNGKARTMEKFSMTEAQVRQLASRMGVHLEKGTEFWKEWQERARKGKIRPLERMTCEICSKVFFITRCQRKYQPYRFCSNTCSGRNTSRKLEEHGHPRGMLGKHHSQKTKELLSAKGLGRKVSEETKLKTMKTKDAKGIYAPNWKIPGRSWKSGRAEDIDGGKAFFRSSWERNYARYLNFLVGKKEIKGWEFEPKTFWFDKIKSGTVSYKPDFLVHRNDGTSEWHEVKGWMDKKSILKLKRMRIYFPNEKLFVIANSEYNEIKKSAKSISPFWEY